MASGIDPYTTLGIAKDASQEDIKSAYRRVARRLHPDVNQNNPGAAAQFQDITAAYELLMDSDRKRSHDNQIIKKTTGENFNFTLRVTPSKRAIIALADPQFTYLLAEILPDPRARDQQQKRESRLNLTLVLDHSNSMNGTRLDKVKVAAHQIND